jgi:filamentous hemagglutinin family protein
MSRTRRLHEECVDAMRVTRLILLAGTALCAPGGIAGAQAPAPNTLPVGGSVLAGQASIATPAPNRMQITQGSDRAVIGWQSFSIGGNAAVDIRQPGAGSISVQQVQGTDPSRVFGALTSNGRVVVANPAGVWFGPEARVDAAGIAAAAGRMSPGAIGQFMADGQVRLDQGAAPGAQVVNEGRISIRQGGLAALVGPTARNAGTIEVRLGRVQIAGGEGATVDFDGDGLIAVRAAPGALAENTGRITADGGRVRMTVAEAKGVLAGAVNMAGVVEARSVVSDQGGITLGGVHAEGPSVTIAGRVDATGAAPGQRGGTVTAVGNTVTVRAGARVDASGAQGGGTIRVGGDARGAAGTRTARTTRVEQGATLAADATTAGVGGTVVVWADGTADFAGSITARGAGAGAGGFAEVSGLGGFTYAGTADLTAASGRWGTLLLDPTAITIVGAGGTDTIPDPATPGSVDLNVGAVVAALGLADVTLAATDTITVNAAVTWDSGGTLRLEANDVAVNQAIRSNGAGGFEVAAGNNVTLGGPITMAGAGSTVVTAKRDITLSNTVTATGTGGLTLQADFDGNGTGAALVRGNISLTSGALDVRGATVSIGQTVTRNLSVTTDTGAITLTATVGNVDIGTTAASNSNTTVQSNGGGTITITAANDVLVRGTTATAGTGTWSQVRSQTGSVSVTAGGDVILRSRPSAGITGDSFGRIIAGTGMTIVAGQDVIVGTGSGASTNPANSASNFLETLGGTQTITAGGNVIVQAGGQNADARIRAAGDQVITTTRGRLDVFANGSAASVTAGGRQEITANGAVTLRGSNTGTFGAEITNVGGAQTITTPQLLDLRARTGLSRISNSGGNQVLAGGSVRVWGGDQAATIINAGGAQTLRATTGAMLVQGGATGTATVANAGGAQAISAATTLDLLAGIGTGNAVITNGTGGQSVSAPAGSITLTGRGGHAAILANGGPQTITSGATLRLAGGAAATPLGLSEATPTGAPTAGSASIQSIPGTAPGVAAGAADQTVTVAGLAFDGPAGTAVIGLQDWRAINDSPGALPRFQSVLVSGVEASLSGSTTVVALIPPPGPPVPPPPAPPVAPPAAVDAAAAAFRLLTEGTPPQPAAGTLAASTGGFTPAGLADGENFQPAAVVVEGEDPAAVFANTVLATRVEGLLPPPVPYFSGYVPPPAAAVR